jgi:uncharacterized protein YjbJ (UPF0337 family)
MANYDQLKGNWGIFKGDVKKEWGNLTDDDFMASEGDMDSLIGRIQARYGDAKETIREKLDRIYYKMTSGNQPKRDVA